MGFIDSFLGNASTVDVKKVEKELESILIAEEQVEAAFKVFRDLMVFTEKRLILVDKQGMTGKKVEYHSIPFKSISHFSVETAGTFDLDAELKIWVSSATEPIVDKQFKKDSSIYDIQKILAAMCL
ncbi:PH domain-containing protein [Sporosarcina aquimarina]|uniref:PH domain-containing protein n=1 Tax=Sporosarcina aquimarina TaxID=114975 RepID=A0ABU4FYJ1_9BACL|nr:PH domain-containing protein [Sporosarcina aquimarina]MDW0109788.1 PH domain-containing protein [Sporosarcina aquimarina]